VGKERSYDVLKNQQKYMEYKDDSDDFDEYSQYTHNLTGMCHVQEYAKNINR
jgi:hypothetical protein